MKAGAQLGWGRPGPPCLIKGGGHAPLKKGQKSLTGVHIVPNLTNFLENFKKKIGPQCDLI